MIFGARNILDFAPLSLGRGIILSRQLREERKIVRIQSQFLSMPTLARTDLLERRGRKSNETTAFILGTGATVNSLGPGQFNFISKCFSIGINQWAIHDFVPDIYLYEFEENPVVENQYLRPDVLKADPLIIVLRMRSEHELEAIENRGVLFGPRYRIYGRVNGWSRKRRNIAKERLFLEQETLVGENWSVVPDNGASVARALNIAISLGFREIVMLGVDLANTVYFWQDDERFLRRRGISNLRSGQKNSLHETLETSHRPVSISEYIALTATWVRDREGIQLYAGSQVSLLSSFLPIFEWPPSMNGSRLG